MLDIFHSKDNLINRSWFWSCSKGGQLVSDRLAKLFECIVYHGGATLAFLLQCWISIPNQLQQNHDTAMKLDTSILCAYAGVKLRHFLII